MNQYFNYSNTMYDLIPIGKVPKEKLRVQEFERQGFIISLEKAKINNIRK